MTLAAGKLRHRISIQRLVETQNPVTGAVTVEWVLYAERWAEYVAQSVREFIAAAAVQSEVKGRFTVRTDELITADMRVIHRGKAYQILGVMPDPDSGLEYMTLAVSEGVIVV